MQHNAPDHLSAQPLRTQTGASLFGLTMPTGGASQMQAQHRACAIDDTARSAGLTVHNIKAMPTSARSNQPSAGLQYAKYHRQTVAAKMSVAGSLAPLSARATTFASG